LGQLAVLKHIIVTPGCHTQNLYCPGLTGTYGNPQLKRFIIATYNGYKIEKKFDSRLCKNVTRRLINDLKVVTGDKVIIQQCNFLITIYGK
jgi:hypothetical protein